MGSACSAANPARKAGPPVEYATRNQFQHAIMRGGGVLADRGRCQCFWLLLHQPRSVFTSFFQNEANALITDVAAPKKLGAKNFGTGLDERSLPLLALLLAEVERRVACSAAAARWQISTAAAPAQQAHHSCSHHDSPPCYRANTNVTQAQHKRSAAQQRT